MKLKQALFAAVVFTGALTITGAASASTVLYSNGPLDGQTDAFTINYGYAVADSFTAPNGSVATGLDFVTWNYQGDVLSSVDWAVSNGNPFTGGTVIASGTASSVASTDLGAERYGYDLQDNVISLGSVTLTGGDYWISLQNAGVPSGNPIYWDENNGPSSAYDTGIGNLAGWDGSCCTGSETFSVLSAAPEPAAWAMMLVGFGGVGAAMRAARRKSGAMAMA